MDLLQYQKTHVLILYVFIFRYSTMFVELQQHHFRLYSVTPFRPEHLRDFDFCWFGCFNQIRWEAQSGDQS